MGKPQVMSWEGYPCCWRGQAEEFVGLRGKHWAPKRDPPVSWARPPAYGTWAVRCRYAGESAGGAAAAAAVRQGWVMQQKAGWGPPWEAGPSWGLATPTCLGATACTAVHVNRQACAAVHPTH
jgi:hypothetical protein